jgi:hypothetical protein
MDLKVKPWDYGVLPGSEIVFFDHTHVEDTAPQLVSSALAHLGSMSTSSPVKPMEKGSRSKLEEAFSWRG